MPKRKIIRLFSVITVFLILGFILYTYLSNQLPDTKGSGIAADSTSQAWIDIVEASASRVDYIVTGSGGFYLSGIFQSAEMEITGSAMFDPETGILILNITKHVDNIFGVGRIHSILAINPHTVSGKEISFNLEDTIRYNYFCENLGGMFNCTLDGVGVDEERPWYSLFGSAIDVQTVFGSTRQDYYGTATSMPVVIENGTTLSIVYHTTTVVELIDFVLNEKN